jgi:hypothetical protein
MNAAERYLEEKQRATSSSAQKETTSNVLLAEQKSNGRQQEAPSTLSPSVDMPQKSKRNGLAIASLVCAIIGGYASTLSIPAVICGHIALHKIKQAPNVYTGKGLAIAGLIIGYAGLILALVLGAVRAQEKNMIRQFHNSQGY